MRFLDKGKTAILVFLFTFVVSIIGLYVNKGPLMDLFFSLDGGLCQLLWHAYTQNMGFISLITSLLLLILSIFIMESFKH